MAKGPKKITAFLGRRKKRDPIKRFFVDAESLNAS
jgi:hypothetical protein